jgi:hypothetical protein
MSKRQAGFTLIEFSALLAVIGLCVALLLPTVQSQARNATKGAYQNQNVRQQAVAMFNYVPLAPGSQFDGFLQNPVVLSDHGYVSFAFDREVFRRQSGSMLFFDQIGGLFNAYNINWTLTAASPPPRDFSLGLSQGLLFNGTLQSAAGRGVVQGTLSSFEGNASVVDSEILLTPVRGRQPLRSTMLALRPFFLPEGAIVPPIFDSKWLGFAASEKPTEPMIQPIELWIGSQEDDFRNQFLGLFLIGQEHYFTILGTVDDSGRMLMIGQGNTGRVFLRGHLSDDETETIGFYQSSIVNQVPDCGSFQIIREDDDDDDDVIIIR